MLLQIIIDNQKEMEILKKKITSLTLQVREQERSSHLETIKSKWYNYKPTTMDYLKTSIYYANMLLYNPTLTNCLQLLIIVKVSWDSINVLF